ncbi:MAG TPA: hypothetical protein VFF39_05910 [Verrucomicrobiae bacterium]|jgi:hypothetical protein|nr:hypothetical protein [Verrucomicrobiae bacterium]
MSKRLLVLVLLLSAVAAMAATNDTNTQQATLTSGIRTYLMPDLSFKSVFVLDMLPQPEAVALQADNLAAPKQGFCQCGCGIRCTTSADCGGNACRPFITCCARKSPTPEAEWFTRSFESSSHKTQSDEILRDIVKAECK